jgi:hypothetical protein
VPRLSENFLSLRRVRSSALPERVVTKVADRKTSRTLARASARDTTPTLADLTASWVRRARVPCDQNKSALPTVIDPDAEASQAGVTDIVPSASGRRGQRCYLFIGQLGAAGLKLVLQFGTPGELRALPLGTHAATKFKDGL